MKALLGKKVGMTQVFSKGGDCVPVTVIEVDRCVPLLKRTQKDDGYDAVLVGDGERKEKHTNKPLKGFYDKIKASPARTLAEFRDQDLDDAELGKPLKVDIFAEGDTVSVIGVSKGKGFAGVMKRFGFGGYPASRGTHESFRGGGSIGMHTYPGRVFKGKEMPGRDGGKTINLKSVEVVQVDADNNILLVKGPVPGSKGTLLRIIKKKA